LLASGAEVAVASTGIAGPGGGTQEKPVGLVYIALARRGAETLSEEHRFSGDRLNIKEATCRAALELLRRALAGEEGS
jgi:PncC family amidohydrolase